MSKIQTAITDVLQEIGEDPLREGLARTPERYENFLREFLSCRQPNFTTFQNEGNDEMIVCTDIPFYSLCEHHLLPFFGVAHIGYLPNGRIVGLSKIPRALEYISRRPQNQERITTQVAELLRDRLDARGVGVVLQARHLCMEMRGVKKPGVMTTTSKMLGAFYEQQQTRQEFFQLIKK